MSVHMAPLGDRTYMAQCQDCDWHHVGTLAVAFNAWLTHNKTHMGAPRANENAPTTHKE